MGATLGAVSGGHANTGNVAVARPTGTTDGDLLVALGFADPDGTTFNPPAGWTQQGTTLANTVGDFKLWWKVAASEPTSYTWTADTNASRSVWMFRVLGADTSTPFSAGPTTATGSSSTSHVAPTLSPADAGTLLICGAMALVAGSGTVLTYTPPLGMSEQGDAQPTPTRYIASTVATQELAASGATGTRTFVASVARVWNAVSVAIKPAGGAAPPGTGAGVGSFAFVGTGVGKRSPRASSTGSFTFASSGSGKRTPKAASSGAVAFTGSATGSAPAVAARSGSGSGMVTFTGTASGRTVRRGTGAGSLACTGSAAGKRSPRAAGNATLAFVGTATGKRSPKASGSGGLALTGTAIGNSPTPGLKEGAGSGSVAWSGAATGRRSPKGGGSGSLALVGTGVGKRAPLATGTGSLALVGVAVGSRPLDPDQIPVVEVGPMQPARFSAAPAIPTAVAAASHVPRYTTGPPQPQRYRRT